VILRDKLFQFSTDMLIRSGRAGVARNALLKSFGEVALVMQSNSIHDFLHTRNVISTILLLSAAGVFYVLRKRETRLLFE